MAIMLPFSAHAQSTGSIDFENDNSIVVTGARDRHVGGVEIPDTPKAKVEISSELIRRPGSDDQRYVEPCAGRQFYQQRPVWLVGWQFHDPRLFF